MITVAILTVSDSASGGSREDLSGPALSRECQQLGWEVKAQAVVPDDRSTVQQQLTQWILTREISLILTTGGTGVSARDVTPEATRAVIQKELPGVAELMRAKGLEQTPTAVLSRGLAGTNRETLVVNLPGSPRGAIHALNTISHLVPHVIDLLQGRTAH